MIRRSCLVLFLLCIFLLPVLALDKESERKSWRNPKDGMEFVRIPPGSLLAEIPNDSTSSEIPSTQRIEFPEGFWMGRTEVTRHQFQRFVQETGYVTEAEKAAKRWNWREPGIKQKKNHPVVFLGFQDALHYAQWAGVDIPTQAEWLYAARANTTTRYFWGNTFDPRYVWHRGNSVEGTHPVGRTLPNPWGLYDVVGSVWEYCKVGDTCFEVCGGSWTRCPEYLTRQGFVAHPLEDILLPRLTRCEPNPQYPPYPYDDDRGFRCIRRITP